MSCSRSDRLACTADGLSSALKSLSTSAKLQLPLQHRAIPSAMPAQTHARPCLVHVAPASPWQHIGPSHVPGHTYHVHAAVVGVLLLWRIRHCVEVSCAHSEGSAHYHRPSDPSQQTCAASAQAPEGCIPQQVCSLASQHPGSLLVAALHATIVPEHVLLPAIGQQAPGATSVAPQQRPAAGQNIRAARHATKYHQWLPPLACTTSQLSLTGNSTRLLCSSCMHAHRVNDAAGVHVPQHSALGCKCIRATLKSSMHLQGRQHGPELRFLCMRANTHPSSPIRRYQTSC